MDIEERNGVVSSIFSGYKHIGTEQTVEAQVLVGEAPEERARAEREERPDA